MSQEHEFDDFFTRGERLSDISELAAFAMNEEERGDRAGAAQLYRWTIELIDDLGEATADAADLRLFAGEALLRLEPRRSAA